MFILFELILIAVITFAFLKYVFSYSAPETFQMKWMADDLAMLTESTLSVPGIVIFNYQITLETKSPNPNSLAVQVPVFGFKIAPGRLDPSKLKVEITKFFVNVNLYNANLKKEAGVRAQHTFSNPIAFSLGSARNFTYFFKVGKSFWTVNETVGKIDFKGHDCMIKSQKDTEIPVEKKIAFIGDGSLDNELMKGFVGKSNYGVVTDFEQENADIVIDIECGSPAVIISNSLPVMQKLACMLADKLKDVDYANIRQEYFEYTFVEPIYAVKISFNCDKKEAGAIKDAIEQTFG